MLKIFRTSIQLTLIKLAALLALISWLVSCGSEEELNSAPTFFGPHIRTGITCGLCTGICRDTLIITPELLFYKGTAYTSDGENTIIKNAAFSQAEWDDLIGTIDVQSFNVIDREASCFRCADGCDVFYDIKTENAFNSIVVGWRDTIPALGDFQSKVEEIRLSFQN